MLGKKAFFTRLIQPRVLLVIALGGVLSAGLWSRLSAELGAPRASDRQVTLIVSSLMRREHLLNHPLDNEISARGLNTYLKMLDPAKVYFTQSDIDEFLQHRNDLDDMVKRGDISFAYTVFNRFLKRVDERVILVDALLTQRHDYTIDEELVTDWDLVRYARNDRETHERWRKRIKFNLLVLKSQEGDDEDAAEKKDKKDPKEVLSRRYRSMAKRYHQFSNDDVLELFLTSITTSFDPHTSYMSPSSLDNFTIMMRLELEGIGAQLSSIDGDTVVTKVISGGAADKHGKLKAEDKIIGVGQGEDGEIVDVVDMNLNDVVKKIRGPAGTIVRLRVVPDSGGEAQVYSITRAKIELKDSEARFEIIKEGRNADGSPMQIGVINLPSFYMDMEGARNGNKDFKSTTRDVAKILEHFNSEGVDVVVLDLRANGGGSLTEAINLTGLFIEAGPVVQVKDSDGRVRHHDDLDRNMLWKGPLVVLTGKSSASASEILAGAIQDYQRGLIVGDKSTHGKGTVQSLLDLGSQLFRIPNPPNLGALKITMQQFFRPNGDSTQKRGVIPDLILPSFANYRKNGEADHDYAIDFAQVPSAEYTKYDMVRPDMVAALKADSTARRSASDDFIMLLKNIEKYREQKDLKSVTLNEEKFFALRAELDADKEDEKEYKQLSRSDNEIVHRDFYFNEVLAISQDYVNQLEKLKIARAN